MGYGHGIVSDILVGFTLSDAYFDFTAIPLPKRRDLPSKRQESHAHSWSIALPTEAHSGLAVAIERPP